MTEICLVQVDPFHYLYQERSCGMAPTEISEAMGETFEAVGRFIAETGVKDVGRPISVYPVHQPDRMIFRAGYIVPRETAQKARGDVHAGEIPDGRVLHYVHRGPYAKLRETYDHLMDYAAGNGLTISAPAWEIYLNEPGEVASEDDLETAVYVSLDRKAKGSKAPETKAG